MLGPAPQVPNGSEGVLPSHAVHRNCPCALQSWAAWQHILVNRRLLDLAHYFTWFSFPFPYM